MQTMLSLSKLSLLASSSSSSSEAEDELEQINSELKKIEFQEAISHISLEVGMFVGWLVVLHFIYRMLTLILIICHHCLLIKLLK